MNCQVCDKPANKRCVNCITNYCSRECQKNDWNNHKYYCFDDQTAMIAEYFVKKSLVDIQKHESVMESFLWSKFLLSYSDDNFYKNENRRALNIITKTYLIELFKENRDFNYEKFEKILNTLDISFLEDYDSYLKKINVALVLYSNVTEPLLDITIKKWLISDRAKITNWFNVNIELIKTNTNYFNYLTYMIKNFIF